MMHYNYLNNIFIFNSSMPHLCNNKKQRTDNNNDNTIVQVINEITQQKLTRYNKNCFFSTYGLFCLLDMLKNGSTGEVYCVLKKLIDSGKYDQNVHHLATSNDVFQNTSLVFHAAKYELNNNFIQYLKSNNILCNKIEINELTKRVSEINHQLEQMTGNKIKEALDAKDFNADFVMLLLNVLYFKDAWYKQFDDYHTEQMVFKNGQDTIVDMMKITNLECNYYENKTFQYLSLPYATYPYKMFIALPK